MKIFASDRDRLAFLIEIDAARILDSLDTLAADKEEPEPDEAKGLTPKGPDSQDRPKYVTNYIGSKQKLVDWIWRNTPQNLVSAVDAFSGSAVVSYMYKSNGLQVATNDRMWLNYHIARAIVENKDETITDVELETLLADNPKAGTFVQDNFGDLYYAKGVHAIIDTIRTNIDQLKGYKKDIALFALGKACLLGKGGFAHFNSTVQKKDLQDSPEEFKNRYRKIVPRINELVFDNGEDNKAYREEIGDFLPQVKADVAYFDPPYATEFSSTNYENTYHFVEGLMTYWNGLTLDESSKRKIFQSDHKTVTKGNANEFFSSFLSQAKHIPHWLISYRDHAFPTEGEIKKIIAAQGRDPRMKSHDHQYLRAPARGEASQAKERLFVCRVNQEVQEAPDQGDKQENKQSTESMEPKEAALEIKAPNIHTSIPIVLNGLEKGKLSTEALEQIPQGSDPQFTFVLCRVGTNKNGDHFTSEELSTRYMTVLNKKIDLKHSQDFTDIVGGIIAANFVVEDSSGGYIECVGELYVTDSPHARLAYKLIKKLVVSQVSMECDYEEGECSICGKRVKSKEEYCVHLNKFKGREYQGKPVFEILHGVTFTGLGLLDRKGADDNARITKVGSEPVERGDNKPDPKNENESENTAHQSAAADKSKVNKQGELSMADKVQEEKNQDTKSDDGEIDTDVKSTPPSGGDANRVKELEKENRLLRQKLTSLQKKLEDLESAQKAAANRARAEKLVSKMKDQEIFFQDETDLTNELERLADLSDDAFAATEATIDRMIRSRAERRKQQDARENQEKEEKAKEEIEPKAAEKTDEKNRAAKTKASQTSSTMRSSANVRPHDVDDAKANLEDQLREVLMTAYRQRVSFNFDEE